ncbi:MAG TPA: type II toxin-antitoxin system RelB/DinJ family antitoxin [Longimicrobium sp.]|nr:type II toxin-antitoxin system RelB/DinJ family antitoxin [Longimicrobium sp.]
MPKTKSITVRLDSELKEDVESIFSELGISVSQAISIFYKQVQLHNGLPFEVRVPNATTRRALADAEARRGVVSHGGTEELFDDLGI